MRQIATIVAATALAVGGVVASTGTAEAAGAWYAVPRTGGGNPGYINVHLQPGDNWIQETIEAPDGPWCWHQTTNCGSYVTGPAYQCYSGAPVYKDWLPVALSTGKKGYVARHCVIATYE
ncbi:hypothetical protein ACFYZJ_17690 [Streptomyces sp. NPDC001848]|uniref:hypothetical protein n=1 Tax=Streptomyces sp. NPDC001848 TaxID=3364618 RepID=UPI0036908762